jgi:hypothetical protein
MSAPYSPWQTRSQFKAVEPRPVVVVRLQYQCEAEGQTGTDSASRLAAGRSRCLPGMQFVGAVRALLSRFSPLVQLRQKTTRGLFESLQFSPFARVSHEGNSSDGVSQGVVRE